MAIEYFNSRRLVQDAEERQMVTLSSCSHVKSRPQKEGVWFGCKAHGGEDNNGVRLWHTADSGESVLRFALEVCSASPIDDLAVTLALDTNGDSFIDDLDSSTSSSFRPSACEEHQCLSATGQVVLPGSEQYIADGRISLLGGEEDYCTLPLHIIKSDSMSYQIDDHEIQPLSFLGSPSYRRQSTGTLPNEAAGVILVSIVCVGIALCLFLVFGACMVKRFFSKKAVKMDIRSADLEKGLSL